MMARRAWAVAFLLFAAVPARADLVREELRIPIAQGNLEALLIRPEGSGRYPLALISHGSPRDPSMRTSMTPGRLEPQAREFARRGFATLIVMRRGYGASVGAYAENSGPCLRRDYLLSARASASDLRAATDAVAKRSDVTTKGMIAVGVSAGGFASVALSADPPPGLAAVISFAGGRGSSGPDEVCDEASLIGAFGKLGATSRVPQLWIYAANDHFFAPALAHRMHAAFTTAGGKAQFIDAPAFGDDGHFLFAPRGAPIWTPMVDRFLRDQHLGEAEAAALAKPNMASPPQLGANGRENFQNYLGSGSHKAFAVAPNGAFGWRSGRRTADEAREAALAACTEHASGCAIYAVDEALAKP